MHVEEPTLSVVYLSTDGPTCWNRKGKHGTFKQVKGLRLSKKEIGDQIFGMENWGSLGQDSSF